MSCPTGALTNKRVLGQNLLEQSEGGEVHSIETEELLALPVFKGVSGTFLELNRNAVVKRRYKAGEVVVRGGENGSNNRRRRVGHAELP